MFYYAKMEYHFNPTINLEDPVMARCAVLGMTYKNKKLLEEFLSSNKYNAFVKSDAERDLKKINKEIEEKTDLMKNSKRLKKLIDNYFSTKEALLLAKKNIELCREVTYPNSSFLESDLKRDVEKIKEDLREIDSNLENLCLKMENVFAVISPEKLDFKKGDINMINNYIKGHRDYKIREKRRSSYNVL